MTVAYLEEEELIVGVKYDCERYDGDTCILEYTGDGRFGPGMTLGGVVRYVLREAVSPIAGLRRGDKVMMDCAGDGDMFDFVDAVPVMLDLLETAIAWRDADCDDAGGQAMLAILARFDALPGSASPTD